MSLCAIVLVKYFRKNNPNLNGSSAFKVEVLSSLHLTGRDKFFVVHCGTDIIAFVLTSNGAYLMGRWKYEEFVKVKTEE